MSNSNVVVIGCTKRKKNYTCTAKEMYSESTLFNKALLYAHTKYLGYDILILSAKYGIVELNTMIDTYDTTIKDIHDCDVLSNEVQQKLNGYSKIILLCGRRYDRIVSGVCPNADITRPLAGMGIGKRLKFLGTP